MPHLPDTRVPNEKKLEEVVVFTGVHNGRFDRTKLEVV